MLTVGYIGLGLMGKSIARNIHKAGFPLVVHNRSRAAVDELVAEGASAAGFTCARSPPRWTWYLPTCPIRRMWRRWCWVRRASWQARGQA